MKIRLIIVGLWSAVLLFLSLRTVGAFGEEIYAGSFYPFTLPFILAAGACLLMSVLGLACAKIRRQLYWIVVPTHGCLFFPYYSAIRQWPGGDDGPGLMWGIFVGLGACIAGVIAIIFSILEAILYVRKRLEARNKPLPFQVISEVDQFSIESLWNAFEKRSWHYLAYKATLEKANPRLLNWIGSIDHSGHTREACLLYLIAHYVPGDENRILLRLSDWVPQVQQHARKWVLANFESLPWDSIKRNDRLILFLSRKEHLVGDPAMKHIKKVLAHRVSSLHKEAFFALAPEFRKYLFVLSLINDQSLRGWILDDPEPFIRSLLLSHPACQPLLLDEIIKLKTDKSVFVRRRYLAMKIENNIQPSQQELTDFIFDRNRGLRDFASFYLKQYYGVDAYNVYKESNADNFYYIADSAKKEDIVYFHKGLKSSRKDIRLLCLRALAVADVHELVKLDIPSLLREGKMTRAVICPNLPRLFSREEINKFRDAFNSISPNGIVLYLYVLNRKSYWAFIDASLAEIIAGCSEVSFKHISKTILSRAYVYETLPADVRTSIGKKMEILSKRENAQIAELVQHIKFIVRTT